MHTQAAYDHECRLRSSHVAAVDVPQAQCAAEHPGTEIVYPQVFRWWTFRQRKKKSFSRDNFFPSSGLFLFPSNKIRSAHELTLPLDKPFTSYSIPSPRYPLPLLHPVWSRLLHPPGLAPCLSLSPHLFSSSPLGFTLSDIINNNNEK